MAFLEADWLKELHHTLAWTELPFWTKALPKALRTQTERRRFPQELAPYLHRHPLPEWGRLLAARLPIPLLRRVFSIQSSNRRFDRAVAGHLHQHPGRFNAVYGYFDTALQTFREAKRQGLPCLYELPTPYWRTVDHLVETETHRHPNWVATLPTRSTLANSAAQRDEELRLADLIIVPSPFVRDSLALAPSLRAKIIVVPYGCPEPNHEKSPRQNQELRTKNQEPLKLLFVGTLSQSKGLADLLEAIEPLGDRVQLTLAGSPSTSELPIIRPSVRILGQLPHAELLATMRRHDLLVLPTLYEGLSLALLEALSQGLPVVSTNHSGLAGLIENHRHACLVPAADPVALRTQIERLIQNPQELTNLAQAGRDWASEHTWSRYRQELCQALRPLMKGPQ